jgi:hypothetical protein
LVKPHMTPDIIEYQGALARRSRTISSSRLTPHPTRWVALDPRELLLEKAA